MDGRRTCWNDNGELPSVADTEYESVREDDGCRAAGSGAGMPAAGGPPILMDARW